MPLTYEGLKLAPQQRKRSGVFLACETCKKEFYVMPCRLRQAERQKATIRYCSNDCYDKHGEKNPFFGMSHKQSSIDKILASPTRHSFVSGQTNPNVVRYGADFKHQESRRLRERLLQERGASCEKCGFDAVPGVLEVHHRDRNRRNNDRENLGIMCPTCHAVDHFMQRDGAYNRLKRAA